MHVYEQEQVAEALAEVLKLVNETLDEFAADGWIVTLYPAGHLYEARIVTPNGLLVLRPEEKRESEATSL